MTWDNPFCEKASSNLVIWSIFPKVIRPESIINYINVVGTPAL